MKWAIPERKQSRGKGGLRTYFLEKSPGFFRCFTLPFESPDKTKLHAYKFHKILLHLSKILRLKSRLLEIPYYFSLIPNGNSKLFLVNPWRFHSLLLQYPWKFHIKLKVIQPQLKYKTRHFPDLRKRLLRDIN